jgi:hypothetical protein
LACDPALLPWDDLPEDWESNRQQTDHIFIKLRVIGCEAVPASDPRPAVSKFTSAEMELMDEIALPLDGRATACGLDLRAQKEG